MARALRRATARWSRGVLAGKGALQGPPSRTPAATSRPTSSRQVLALIDGGKVVASTTRPPARRRRRRCSGASASTCKTPGTNAKGMVALELLHPRLRDPRLRRRAGLQRQPRLPARPDPERARAIYNWLRHRRPRARVPVGGRWTARETPRRGAAPPRAGRRRGHADLAARTAQYYVDAKRAILRPAGLRARWPSWSPATRAQWEATAVGGLTMGADAPACAALAGGADVKAFFVRKETKAHGLQRRDRGPAARARASAA